MSNGVFLIGIEGGAQAGFHLLSIKATTSELNVVKFGSLSKVAYLVQDHVENLQKSVNDAQAIRAEGCEQKTSGERLKQ